MDGTTGLGQGVEYRAFHDAARWGDHPGHITPVDRARFGCTLGGLQKGIYIMKATTSLSLKSEANRVKRISLGLVVAAASLLLYHNATAMTPPVPLGTTSSFAVLAGAGITIAGAVNTTTITGDIGSFATTSITGLGNVVLTGSSVNHAGDAVTQGAKNDLVTAFNDAASAVLHPPTTTYTPIFDLGGLILTPGVYNDPSSFAITGTLTLDGQGDPNAVWIFQTGSTLTTASSSIVSVINSGQACNVFWQIGSSATLGTDTDFAGTILAADSITLNTGATVSGQLLAETGAVTLDTNTIAICAGCDVTGGSTVPDGGSTLLLLASGLAALLGLGRRYLALA